MRRIFGKPLIYPIWFVWGLAAFLISKPLLLASNLEGIQGENTREILKIFEQISDIPRCSTREKALSSWLKKWAKDKGLKTKSDSKGNLVIEVPASEGYENAPIVVLQGHLDMVCEKAPESGHDFNKDSIKIIREEEWLRADQTTLGADNGLGIALCMTLVEDKTVAHPPLEMLFTVEEEIGLKGAAALKPNFFKGKIFINVDSEGEGVLTIGSAGGTVSIIALPTTAKNLPKRSEPYKLYVAGLQGGHSGLDIHKNRGNAIKILASVLDGLYQAGQFRIISVKGGTKANAIPREAEALLAFEPAQFENFQQHLVNLKQTIQNELTSAGENLAIELSPSANSKKTKSAITREDTENIIKLLNTLPNGVANMSAEFDETVEMSNNIGLAYFNKNTFFVLSLERSAAMEKIETLHSKIKAASSQVKAKAKVVNQWPAWKPNEKSALLKRSKKVYHLTFGKEPQVQVVHGGLECNVVAVQNPRLDMIAIGPTIENTHSPDERLYIPSVAKLWKFLKALLQSYAE